MKNLVYVILLTFVVSMSTACKDVCEKAADVAEDDCGLEAAEGDGDEEAEEVECTGDTEAGAQCIVDNGDEFCEYLDKLGEGDFTFTNAYTDCVGEI